MSYLYPEDREKSPFQELMEADARNVFLNLDEFATMHTVEGRKIAAVMAPVQNVELGGGYALGVASSSITLHAATEDLPEPKESGETLNIDGREYIVGSWNIHNFMTEILLKQTRTT